MRLRTIILSLVVLTAVRAPALSVFTRADKAGWWGETGNWQNSTLPTSAETGIEIGLYSAANVGHPFRAYLMGGDSFSYPSADVQVGFRNGAMPGTVCTVSILKNASLSVKNVYIPGCNSQAGMTGVVEVTSGVLSTAAGGGSVFCGAQHGSTGILKLKKTTLERLSTIGWLGRGEIYADAATISIPSANCLLGNSDEGALLDLRNQSKLVCGNLSIGSNVLACRGDLVAVDSTVEASGDVTVGLANPSSFVQTNAMVRNTGATWNSFYIGSQTTGLTVPGQTMRYVMSGASTNTGYQSVQTRGGNADVLVDGEGALLRTEKLFLLSDFAAATQNVTLAAGRIEVSGSGANTGLRFQPGADSTGHTTGLGMIRFRQTGGTLLASNLTFATRGAHHPRYEISGGTFRLVGKPGASAGDGMIALGGSGSTSGTFSMQGSAPDVEIAYFNGLVHFEYVIDLTGAPTMRRPVDPAWGVSFVDWIHGAHSVRLAGGLQLLHTNACVFIDSHVSGSPEGRDIKAAGDSLYADLNDAPHHLWTFGPHADSSSLPTGVFAGTKFFGAVLNADEEFVSGQRVEEGRSCGWVRIPKFASRPHYCHVLLDVAPQGSHTLAEIAADLSAAGYRTTVLETGTYNLNVEIPTGSIALGSSNECVAFDFADCATTEDVVNNTPDVRALVRQIFVQRSRPGLVVTIFY